MLLLLLLGCGLLAGAYLLGASGFGRGQLPSSASKPEMENSDTWPKAAASDIAVFDRALEAMAAGKMKEAREQIEAVRQEQGKLVFSDFLLARSYLRTKELLAALPLLQASIAKGEMVAASLLEIAQTYRQSPQGSGSADQYFHEAMKANPLEPYAFYYYGEALRKEGRSGEAVKLLYQAKLRASRDSERPIIETRYALARIEASDPSVVSELEATDSLPGNLLVAAAALAVKNDDYAKAGALLTQARAALSPEMFTYLVTDQIFVMSRDRPELRDLLKAGAPKP